MGLESPETKSELHVRLRRIEGQVRGVQRMIDEDRDCSEILQQLAAIRSALHQTSLLLARAYAARCLNEPSRGDAAAMLDKLMNAFARLE